MDAYLNLCEDVFDIRTLTWDVHLPTTEEFAMRLGVSRDTLYALAETHLNYACALSRLKSRQFLRLINGGLSGRYKTWICLLLLRTNHGFGVGGKHIRKPEIGILRTIYP